MNHPMQAGFDAWFYFGIAGINPTPEGPGFQMIAFRPYLTRQLQSASAQYDSKSGRIRSAWKRDKDTVVWNITIPANSRGRIWVPTYGQPDKIKINDKPVEVVEQDQAFSLIGTYGPGDYVVEWQ